MPRGFLAPSFQQHFPMLRPDGKLPQLFNYDFDDPKNEKKWRNPREDITDYFNYGMNEEVWKVYVEKVKKLANKVEKFNKEAPKEVTNLDHTLPIEFGGFGTPHFEQIKHLPFFNAVRNNKERFFLKCFLNDSQTADTLRSLIQEFLSKDEIVEESEKLVREAYEAVEPGLLKLGRTLPPENLYANTKPVLPPNPIMTRALPSMGRDLRQPDPRLDSRGSGQYSKMPQLNQSQVDLLAHMGYNIQQVESKADPKADSRSKSPLKEKPRPDKKVLQSAESSRSAQKHRKERDRKERPPSARREKKKRDVSARSSRSPTRKNKTEKRKEKEKKGRSRSREKERAPDEDRGSKKKSKKEAKEKKNESRKKSKERSRNQKDKVASRSRSSSQSGRKKEVLLKKVNPIADIRQRIQTRKL